VQRAIFVPKHEEVTGENCVMRCLPTTPYKILEGNPAGKRPPLTPGHRWQDNIKTNVKNVACKEVD
jgi:hypothetical protein